MNSFFHWLCNPLLVVAILLLLAFFFKVLKNDRLAYWLFMINFFWLLLVASTPLSQILVYSLEKQHLPFDSIQCKIDTPVYILILGGGHTVSPALPASQQLSATALARLVEGIRIYNQIAGSKLICSGFSASNRSTLAEILADAAIELGVSANDTIQLRSPSNTNEEIRAFKARFDSAPVVLVTSASHMPRAMMIARRYNMNALPAPAEFLIKYDSLVQKYDFYPSAQKIMMMERVLHEYGGIIKVKILTN